VKSENTVRLAWARAVCREVGIFGEAVYQQPAWHRVAKPHSAQIGSPSPVSMQKKLNIGAGHALENQISPVKQKAAAIMSREG